MKRRNWLLLIVLLAVLACGCDDDDKGTVSSRGADVDTPKVVPVPSGAALVGVGLVALRWLKRRNWPN